jgi:hypothetical protein
MILIKTNEIELYIDKRNKCKYRYYNGLSFTCSINSQLCDIDTCIILKKCTSILHFIDIIEREQNE